MSQKIETVIAGKDIKLRRLCDIANYDTIPMENRVTLFQSSGF